jgi:hypothetical protein
MGRSLSFVGDISALYSFSKYSSSIYSVPSTALGLKTVVGSQSPHHIHSNTRPQSFWPFFPRPLLPSILDPSSLHMSSRANTFAQAFIISSLNQFSNESQSSFNQTRIPLPDYSCKNSSSSWLIQFSKASSGSTQPTSNSQDWHN